jgi:hypothetical protein
MSAMSVASPLYTRMYCDIMRSFQRLDLKKIPSPASRENAELFDLCFHRAVRPRRGHFE